MKRKTWYAVWLPTKVLCCFCRHKTPSTRHRKEEAQRAGMPYVDHRWLGGMLTNYKTVKQSIKRLEEKAAVLANAENSTYNKKELLDMTREVEKLERSLGGIKNMKGLPDAIFVIDTGYQHGTLVEAAKLGIPVIAVVDITTVQMAMKTRYSW